MVAATWDRSATDRADASGAPAGSPRWYTALGPRTHATLTTDGRGVIPAWCTCRPEPPIDTWIRYEHWTTHGRDAHGYLCPHCRHITQTG